MKRANLNGFLAGVLVMLILMVSIPALAYSGTKSIDVSYNNIKITLDGKQVTPRDGSGKIVEPFTFDGTTYLPVRAVATALDLAVDWDAATQTVVLGTGVVSNSKWSKDNPAPIGTKININNTSNKWAGAIFVSQVLRGEDALAQFDKKRAELNKVSDDQEILLAKIQIETAPNSQVQWSHGLTQFFSGYSGYNDRLDTAFYGSPDNGDGYVWRAFVIDKSDTQPKIAYEPFGVDDAWFRLY